MKNVAVRYAVVRFQPYPETGEFANIGIIAIDPIKGLFAYKLAERHSKRVTDFFHNLNRNFYLNTVKQIKFELDARFQAVTEFKADAREVFDDLIKPKSNLFQFEQSGALKALDFYKAVDDLYDHFVGHEFAKDKSYEAKLRDRVKHQLDLLELKRPFLEHEVTDQYGVKARFELARAEDRLEAIIKPFGFAGEDPNKLVTHLANETKKLEIALDAGYLEGTDILIPTDIQSKSDQVLGAWSTYKTKLGRFGDLVPANNTQLIEEFAKH